MARSNEKFHVKYGWLILALSALLGLVAGIYLAVFPAPVDLPGVINLTGQSWPDIVAHNPEAVRLIHYFISLFWIADAAVYAMSLIIAVTLYRKGERWALAATLKQTLLRYDALFNASLPYMMVMHQAPTDGGDYDHYRFHIEAHWHRRALRRSRQRPDIPELPRGCVRLVRPEHRQPRPRSCVDRHCGAVTGFSSKASDAFSHDWQAIARPALALRAADREPASGPAREQELSEPEKSCASCAADVSEGDRFSLPAGGALCPSCGGLDASSLRFTPEGRGWLGLLLRSTMTEVAEADIPPRAIAWLMCLEFTGWGKSSAPTKRVRAPGRPSRRPRVPLPRVRRSFHRRAVAMASTKRAPARMMPLCSASGPTMKPLTSCTNSSGVRWRLAVSMKKATFSALSV